MAPTAIQLKTPIAFLLFRPCASYMGSLKAGDWIGVLLQLGFSKEQCPQRRVRVGLLQRMILEDLCPILSFYR
jgi:hypothetical protein